MTKWLERRHPSGSARRALQPARCLVGAVGLVWAGLVCAAGAASAGAGDDLEPETLSFETRTELVQMLLASQARTLELAQQVPEDAWNVRAREGRWSVGEIVEHLALAEGQVMGVVQRLIEGERHPDWQTLDRLPLRRIVELGADRGRRFEAPEPLEPSGKLARRDVLESWVVARAESVRFVLETQAALRTVAAQAPIGQVLDGEGWLALLAAHNQRHNAQLEEVVRALNR